MRRGGGWLVTGLAIALLGIAPAAVSLTAGAIANAHGCQLDEGSVHPCVIAGQDWGDTLYGLGVMFWLELATIWLVPIGLILLVIGLFRFFARP